jgi:hypothetical protein
LKHPKFIYDIIDLIITRVCDEVLLLQILTPYFPLHSEPTEYFGGHLNNGLGIGIMKKIRTAIKVIIEAVNSKPDTPSYRLHCEWNFKEIELFKAAELRGRG